MAEELPPILERPQMLARLANDQGLAREVLLCLLSDVPLRSLALEEAVRQGDQERAAREVHTLKGLALSGGALRFHACLWRLDAICREGGIPSVAELAEMQAHLCELLPHWQAYANELAVMVGGRQSEAARDVPSVPS